MKLKKENLAPIERHSQDINSGLTSEQVQNRISQKLVNKSAKKFSKSYARIFIDNFCTFFNFLGLIVAVSLIIAKAEIQQFFFVLIYLANILVGIVLEIRAKRCIDKLSLISESTVFAIRNGKEIKIPYNEIVLDDVLRLGLGSQIPTDSIILNGEVEVNEAMLTGESVPVKKTVGDILFAGSFIVSGSCYAKADSVGSENYVEKLTAKAKVYKKPYSEIMSTLKLIIKVVSVVIIPIAAAFMLKSIFGHDLIPSEAIKKTVTVVIGMIPSGMFLLTSVALAVGVIKLFKHNTLVQDLYSLEILARVDTICFDKTGTITDGNMEVLEYVKISGNDNEKDIISSMINSLETDNATEKALSNYFKGENILKAKEILPFSSSRKFSAVTFDNGKTYALGAPEFVLRGTEYSKIEKIVLDHANKGERVLAFAESNEAILNGNPPSNFNTLGLIIITDSIRDNVIQTINWFKENGVNVKVISGDNPVTVSQISLKVGIDNADKYISLENLSDEEVIKAANEYTVFGRVSPEQKALLIESMNKAGHVTAMTGDGVNDILALKKANCAISVASGSDAAKNISNLVLTDNNFNSMPKIVYEGRRVINNVQSSASLYFMKTLFTFLLAVFVLLVPAFASYPFELMQMILLEVFVIGLPSFFLSLQKNDSKIEGKFINQMIKKSLPSALIMVITVLIVFLLEYTLKNGNFAPEHWTTVKVFVLTISGFINLFFICKPLNKYRALIFFIPLSIVLTIFTISIINGFSILGLAKLLPLKTYWPLLVITISVCLFAFILYLLLRKINLKIPDKLLHKLKIK